MTTEPNDNLRLEIGHVLFIDIVGYSKLLIEEQKERLNQLTEIVLATAQVREATDEQLVRLPTGDGMALVFRQSAEEPARCALEIAEALRKHPELPVRMGIHSGPVSEVTDVSGRKNLAGAGINMAQRVMDCGDAGHILLSQHVADDLEHSRQWAPRLRDLGECEVKHGVRLHLVNLYAEPLGNAEPPTKFQQSMSKTAAAKPSGRSIGWITALALVAIVAAGAVYYLSSHRTTSNSATIPEKSIAVLPLVNSSGDPANEYFADGMSEEFISTFSRLPDLKVIGRSSSFQFKGKTVDSKTVGEKLGVFYLLEGSVRKSADRVRIAVALAKAGDGANVWSDTYDRELKDIFAVQSEIAGAVAKELKVAVLGSNGQPAQLAGTATPSSQNVDAYNAQLQGNFYYNRNTADDLRKAIGYFEEAIRLDPRYALAYARLSPAAFNLANNFAGMMTPAEREGLNAKARSSADKAVELDPNLGPAHAAKATILKNIDFNFTAAEAEYRRALDLAPHDPGVLANFASLLAKLGRLDEAVALTQRAVALDPLRGITHANLAIYLIALGRYEEAEAAARKAIELQPKAPANYRSLALINILRGKPAAAVEFAKQVPDPVWRTYALALTYFANGQRAEADAALKKLIDENADDAGSQIAQVYALRKEPDKVFEWLEHGWATHDAGVTELLSDPFLLAYKDDPRFIAFAQKIGVMPKGAK
ncbi:MAG: tetratricopeptide repeat protein [Verrucomicrobiota bacterium]|nr:tetratricopeptide repeat protein [Verrucomicrobiota bacterium]